jgi:hypothetical protein
MVRAQQIQSSPSASTKSHRFTCAEVHLLAEALDLPEYIEYPDNQIIEDRVTALCMLVHCLTYPSRLVDIEMEFGWETSQVSRITRFTAALIWDRWKYLLCFDAEQITPQTLACFARAFADKGCPLDLIATIIDRSLKKVACPSHNQHIVFNGWKRIHCLKYHLVVTADGIIIRVFGPVEGRHHDVMLLRESGLTDILEEHFWGPSGEMYFVYGDSAYQMVGHVMAPFKGAYVTEAECAWNMKMSQIREPVEWMFKEVNSICKFLNFSDNQKILRLPCRLFYMVAVLLTNTHTILYGSQTSQYFACPIPRLHYAITSTVNVLRML